MDNITRIAMVCFSILAIVVVYLVILQWFFHIDVNFETEYALDYALGYSLPAN